MLSLPNIVIEQIPIEIFAKSTFQIIGFLSHHVRQNNMVDHNALEAETRGIIFTSDTTSKAYVTQNLFLCTIMFNAELPNIFDGLTTVKYLINVLKSNLDFYQLVIFMACFSPSTIREIMNRLQQATLVQPIVSASSSLIPYRFMTRPPSPKMKTLPRLRRNRWGSHSNHPCPHGYNGK